MKKVRAKKHLGQHFLTDETVARKIGETLLLDGKFDNIIEIGPGMGMLTKYLMELFPTKRIQAIEIDAESVAFLTKKYPNLEVLEADFLKTNIRDLPNVPTALIGNYPYNISTQIVFKVIEYRDRFPVMSGMFQKEVAERICAGPGSKIYGITSVLTQAFFHTEYLFTVDEEVFTPPPKVKSGVLRIYRRETDPPCEVSNLFKIVKQSFNQRRKTLRNSLRPLFSSEKLEEAIFERRPETLTVDEFVSLANSIEN